MITIEYTAHGEPISDFNYHDWLTYIKNNIDSNQTFVVSTSILFFAIRLAICNGEIDESKINFKYQNKILEIDEYGKIHHWPNGFADAEFNLVRNILSCSATKRKQ